MEKDIAVIKRLLEEVLVYLKKNEAAHVNIAERIKKDEQAINLAKIRAAHLAVASYDQAIEVGKQLTKLCYFACYDQAIEFVKSHENISIEQVSFNGFTPLIYASCYNLELTKLLLQRGANVNARGTHGDSVLMIAVQSNAILKNEIVRLLLQSGADYKIHNGNGKTAYDLAASDTKKVFRDFVGL